MCGESEPPCYTTAPLTKEAKSSTIAHVAIAAGRTHAPRFKCLRKAYVPAVRIEPLVSPSELDSPLPSPVTQFIEGGRVSQTLDRVSKTLFDST